MFPKALNHPRFPIIALGGILIVAAIIRFWGISAMDTFHDEGLYSFRSIGYIDFIDNNAQTTPPQWFKDTPVLPGWTKLSFHDHPPMFFLVQNIFFRIFGDSLFISRLPSVLAGLGTIALVYFLCKQIFNRIGQKGEWYGLTGAALLAVNHIHVWISRSAIFESLLTFFIILNVYCFIRFLEDERSGQSGWWKWFGVTLGLILITKYTGGWLIPTYLLYCLIFYRSAFRQWRWYAAAGLAAIIFSPIIIYNAYLYKTVGHFDLQFAYLFHQNTPEWQVSLGKSQEPFSLFIQNLLAMYSIPFLMMIVGGAGTVAWWWKQQFKFGIWTIVAIAMVTFLLVFIGAAFRFLSLYIIPAIVLAVMAIGYCVQHYGSSRESRRIMGILLALFFGYEIFFTTQGVFVEFPRFGVVEVDEYLNRELGVERSIAMPQFNNPHLNAMAQSYYQKLPAGNRAILLVFDENLSLTTRLWLFMRRTYYHGISAVTTGNFKSMLQNPGPAYFKGYEIYFVKGSPDTNLNTLINSSDAQEFEGFIKENLNLQPDFVSYGHGRFPGKELPMLTVYKFTL